MSHVS